MSKMMREFKVKNCIKRMEGLKDIVFNKVQCIFQWVVLVKAVPNPHFR